MLIIQDSEDEEIPPEHLEAEQGKAKRRRKATVIKEENKENMEDFHEGGKWWPQGTLPPSPVPGRSMLPQLLGTNQFVMTILASLLGKRSLKLCIWLGKWGFPDRLHPWRALLPVLLWLHRVQYPGIEAEESLSRKKFNSTLDPNKVLSLRSILITPLSLIGKTNHGRVNPKPKEALTALVVFHMPQTILRSLPIHPPWVATLKSLIDHHQADIEHLCPDSCPTGPANSWIWSLLRNCWIASTVLSSGPGSQITMNACAAISPDNWSSKGITEPGKLTSGGFGTTESTHLRHYMSPLPVHSLLQQQTIFWQMSSLNNIPELAGALCCWMCLTRSMDGDHRYPLLWSPNWSPVMSCSQGPCLTPSALLGHQRTFAGSIMKIQNWVMIMKLTVWVAKSGISMSPDLPLRQRDHHLTNHIQTMQNTMTMIWKRSSKSAPMRTLTGTLMTWKPTPCSIYILSCMQMRSLRIWPTCFTFLRAPSLHPLRSTNVTCGTTTISTSSNSPIQGAQPLRLTLTILYQYPALNQGMSPK